MFSTAGRGRSLDALTAWGRNRNRPGHVLDAFLVEGALTWGSRHMTLAPPSGKDELFPTGEARAGRAFTVGRAEAGYLREWGRGPVAWGVGGLVGLAQVPQALKSDYGDRPVSATLFARARLR